MKKTLFQIFWPLVFLLLLIFSVIFAKTLLSLHLPKYSPQSQVCYFPSEASLQYILSSRIANGESLPDTLTDLQYPEGIKLGEEITVFQEYVCGWSYRFLVSPFWEMDFFLYALIFIAISSSLPILVIYLFGEVVLEHRIAALAGALLYGLCPLTFTRVIGNFGRENFALTFVFLPTILFLAIWKNCDNVRKKHFVALGLFAAFLSQLIAFASWHLSRFVFTLEMGILFLLFLTGILSRKQAFLTGVWVILLIPFTVIIPCLRANLFIFSPGIIVGGYFFISYYLNKKKCKKIHHYTLFFILMVVGIIFSNSTDSHVTTVIIDKLKHFLIKPESPELLAPESRMMWIEAFLSPPLYRIVYYFVPLFPLMTLSSIGAIKYWKQNTAFQLPLAIITLNTLIFGCFYLLFERMHVFFTFYLFCFILIGIIMYCQKRKIRLITSITILTVILSAAQTARVIKKDLAYSFLKNTFDSKDSVVPVTYRQSNLDLIDWIEEETSPDQTFAGWIGIATWIYSYAQRPVLIHSKFENKKIRNKTLELLNALYTTEENLNTFFEKYDGDYLVYQPDMFFNESKESLRYIAGTNDITSQMPVMSLQFFPFDLEKFELVYQNPNYRIFRFLKTPETPYENRPIRYEPIYDRDFFDVQRNVNSSDLQNKEIHLTLIHSLYQQYAFSTELLQAGKTEKATAILTSTGQKCPQFYRAWLLLGKIALKQNKQILAKSYFEKALEGAPDNKEILSLLSAMKKKETDH